MKKRIKEKIEKRKNRKKHEFILAALKNNNLTPISIYYYNEYFLGHLGVHAICHFQVKETPGWLYGIWISNDKCQMFGEFSDFVDKFKPSAVAFCFENVSDFVSQIENISNHLDYYLASYYSYELKKDNFEEIQRIVDEHHKNKTMELMMKDARWKYIFHIFREELFQQFPQVKRIYITDENACSWFTTTNRFHLDIEIYLESKEFHDNAKQIYDDIEKFLQEKNDNGPFQEFDSIVEGVVLHSISCKPYNKKEYQYVYSRENTNE